jgi:hypothetical protein
MPVINSHNGWDPLEEVWLGDVWPKNFYDDLAPDVRDAFHYLTDITKEDLDRTQKFLEDWGVTVRRPFIDPTRRDLYTGPGGRLYKPPISVRDTHCVIGNTLYVASPYAYEREVWGQVLDEYRKDPDIKIKTHPWVAGPSTVRLGRDLMFDRNMTQAYLTNRWDQQTKNIFLYEDWKKWVRTYPPEFQRDYRLHYTTNGGHYDGCFAPLRPGLLLTTKYFKDYELFYPGWDRINISDPTYSVVAQGKTREEFFKNNEKQWKMFKDNTVHSAVGKWQLPGDIAPLFNDYVNQYCKTWVGNFTETFFEVNILVLDHNNILCIGGHDSLFEEFAKRGITAHVTPFRARTFWDGGMHCNTVDIRRKGGCEDYFPDRGSKGIGICKSELPDDDFKLLRTHGPGSVPVRDRSSMQKPFLDIPTDDQIRQSQWQQKIAMKYGYKKQNTFEDDVVKRYGREGLINNNIIPNPGPRSHEGVKTEKLLRTMKNAGYGDPKGPAT